MSNNGTQEQDRNRNRNPNRDSSHNPNRNSNRNRNRGPQGNSQRSHNPNHNPQSQHEKFVSRKPVKLTLWQKLMKMIGLYKEPETKRPEPQRNTPPQRGPRPNTPPQREPRSNTRDARKEPTREARPPRERKPAPVGDVESTRLYLGNLSYETTESDLEELFKGVGPVRSVEIVYNKHTHKSKGYGFVEMLRIDEAKRAIEVLHDQPFMGRNLVVSGAKAKEDMAQEHSRDESPAPVAEQAPVVEAAVAEQIAPSPAPIESDPVEEVHNFSSEEAKKETFV